MRRYVATGGGSSTTIRAKAEFMGSGGGSSSGPVSSAGSGSSDYSSSSPASATGSGSSDPATYSIHYTSPSGGGTAKGTINLIYGALGGGYVIGSPASFSVSVTGSGSPALSLERWSVSGATPVYSGEMVPGPSSYPTGTWFLSDVNTANFNDNNICGWSWGETPGVNTVTVSATVTVFGNTERVEAEKKVYISRPSINARVQASAKSYVWPGYLKTGIGYRGIAWQFSSSSGGQFAVVQVVESGSNYSYVSGGSTYSLLSGATFPLLDNGGASTAWAHGKTGNTLTDGDQPYFQITSSATQLNMVLNMKDYVMYNGGAIWVPVGGFSWTVDAQAAYVAGSWRITNIAAPSATKFAAGSAWPGWNGDVANYTTWH